MILQWLSSAVVRFWPVWLLAVLLAGLLAALLLPWNISGLAAHPRPVQSYAEALQRVAGWRAQQPPAMNPLCELQLMTHGQKVQHAIILVHGYTNCPQQFSELGKRFYALGYNVLIAPLPHHGLADRMTTDHAHLKAEELALYADETLDIAQGLGEQVTMMGISAGGVTTAWAAQNRSDLDLAIIISPAFGFKQIPTRLTAAGMNIYSFLPDEFVWWDAEKKADAAPPQGYPRYSKHALVQTLRLGFAVQAAARRAPLAAKKMVVVLNANDSSVNNELTRQVLKVWQAQGAELGLFEFPLALKLGHDLIDPADLHQNIEAVYPRLIELAGP